jgi:hypothetical protein
MNALANMRLKHKIWLNQKMQKEIKKRYKRAMPVLFQQNHYQEWEKACSGIPSCNIDRIIEIQIMRERGKERIGRNSATILPFTHRYTRAVPKTLPYFSGLVIIMPTIAIIIHQPSDYRVLVTI